MVRVPPLLVVLAGRPGTGKSPAAQRLIQELHGAYLRIDAICSSVLRSALTNDKAMVAAIGYDIARRVARENLDLGAPVVVDGLNATHAQRQQWVALAAAEATLVFVETFLANGSEHRRRIERRSSGNAGYLGPTWDEMQTINYEPWGASRYGERFALEMSDTDSAIARVIGHLSVGPIEH